MAVAGFLLGVLSLVIAPFLAVFSVVMTTVGGAVALHAPLLVAALAGIVVSGVGFVVGWRSFAGRGGVLAILGFVAGIVAVGITVWSLSTSIATIHGFDSIPNFHYP